MQFCINIYYLLKRATLRWHLFKRQTNFVGINQKKYMRPSGTRWVEHQLDNLASHNHNLPILMGFFNQQIIGPHNDSIRKIKDTFIGHKNDATNLDYIFFNGAKEDILGILRPLSKLFQENALLLPSLLTNISRTLRTMTKFQKLFNDEGQEALKREDVFPSLAKLLKMISPVKGEFQKDKLGVKQLILEETSSGSIPIF